MARTTATAVKKIISTDLSDPIVEDGFIASATELVTNALGDDTTLSDDLKEEIEKWVTAHLLASTREQQIQSGEAKGSKVVYQGKTGIGFESTFYGQMALRLDTTGKLASLGRKQVTFAAIGNWDS